MKIVRKDKYSVCEFGELKVGDVFIEIVDGVEEFLQMKMNEVESDEIYNAVSLVTGEPYAIEADTKVRRVHAELIITNIEEA
jgi:hypothetical protein